MYYTFVRGSTKFGCHRAILSYLTPGWPQLTPAWPWTPINALHYTSVKGSSYRIWRPEGISAQFDLWWPWLTRALPLTPAMHYTSLRGSSYQIWWPLGTSMTTWPLDDLWHWLVHFKKLTTNLGGTFPTTLPSFNSMHQSTTKRIAGHTDWLTDWQGCFFN